jgi:bla regulator protein blaR1
MISQLIALLINLTIATSIALSLIGMSRRPLRRAVGAQAAYWLWLMIPGSALAAMIPGPAHTLGLSYSGAMPQSVSHTLASVVSSFTTSDASVAHAVIALLVWAMGAAVMLIFTVRRQQTFVRSLRPLWWLPNDTCRSRGVVEPMLVGAWDPWIVLPADFEERYTQEERALVLAHERAHVQRGDASANAIAISLLCLFWFNPLMFWAIRRFRFDQELACDARVLATTGTVRRQYANALLKIQLSVEPVEPVPIGCHWRSGHPLKERIEALKCPLPGAVRRTVGVAIALVLIVSGSYAAWAMQPVPHAVEGSGARAADNKSC